MINKTDKEYFHLLADASQLISKYFYTATIPFLDQTCEEDKMYFIMAVLAAFIAEKFTFVIMSRVDYSQENHDKCLKELWDDMRNNIFPMTYDIAKFAEPFKKLNS